MNYLNMTVLFAWILMCSSGGYFTLCAWIKYWFGGIDSS